MTARVIGYFDERPSPGVNFHSPDKCKNPECEDHRTLQHFKDECDINVILRRAEAAGRLQEVLAKPQEVYGDTTSAPDFMAAQEIVLKANDQFMSLPADVRKLCDNDPAVFLEKVKDLEWARAHDLAPKPKTGEPLPVAPPLAGGQPAVLTDTVNNPPKK